jgi:hypothetical protein
MQAPHTLDIIDSSDYVTKYDLSELREIECCMDVKYLDPRHYGICTELLISEAGEFNKVAHLFTGLRKVSVGTSAPILYPESVTKIKTIDYSSMSLGNLPRGLKYLKCVPSDEYETFDFTEFSHLETLIVYHLRVKVPPNITKFGGVTNDPLGSCTTFVVTSDNASMIPPTATYIIGGDNEQGEMITIGENIKGIKGPGYVFDIVDGSGLEKVKLDSVVNHVPWHKMTNLRHLKLSCLEDEEHKLANLASPNLVTLELTEAGLGGLPTNLENIEVIRIIDSDVVVEQKYICPKLRLLETPDATFHTHFEAPNLRKLIILSCEDVEYMIIDFPRVESLVLEIDQSVSCNHGITLPNLKKLKLYIPEHEDRDYAENVALGVFGHVSFELTLETDDYFVFRSTKR